MMTFEQRLRDALSHAYDIQRELGGGGMSRVFVAIDRSLGRKVVIKLLSPELTADVNRGRFRREIQVAAQLQHPHIVPLLSAGEHEDLVYYTMPFIVGESLKSALEKNGPLPVEDVVRVLYHVGEALDYAHNEGVVHRDIKPANILRSGTYFLVTDFGVAKAINASMPGTGMTSTGMAVGTPAYMSPEQLAGDASADHRIDIYAAGLLAYELLNGRSPFAASTAQRVLAAVLTHEPKPLVEVRPDVPARLSEIVMRCLAKEPEDRPESARAFLAELDTFSTASGEIRTTEHRIPRRERAVATPAAPLRAEDGNALTEESAATTRESVTPTRDTAAPTRENVAPTGETVATASQATPSSGVYGLGYDPPPKDRSKLVVGAFALLIPLAAAAVFFALKAGDGASAAPPVSADAVALADSGELLPLPPAVVPESVAAPAAPKIDSQAIRDSIRKARAEAAAKRAAARADSIRQAQEAPKLNARRAAAAMLADGAARQSFLRGATGRGGPLGTRRRGDLQTQIDALAPFLANAGLTYDQFKALVAESGVALFDQFGRMIPDSLQRFAGGSN